MHEQNLSFQNIQQSLKKKKKQVANDIICLHFNNRKTTIYKDAYKYDGHFFKTVHGINTRNFRIVISLGEGRNGKKSIVRSQ